MAVHRIAQELTPEVFQKHHDANQQGIARLAEALERLQWGTWEIRNWIATAGAAQHLEMDVFDYVPCYRSPAETGCAMALAQWT